VKIIRSSSLVTRVCQRSGPHGEGLRWPYAGLWCLSVGVLILAIGLLPLVQANELTAPKNGNPLWKISLSALRATVERPLFSASRRPPPPAVVPSIVAPSLPPSQPAAEPDHPQLKLLGTIIGERKEIAVFLDDATKNMISLRIGQDHDGWTLRFVRGYQVDFEKEHRIATLVLPRYEAALHRGKRESQTTSASYSDPRPAPRRRGGRLP
jgi:hypothetical protein